METTIDQPSSATSFQHLIALAADHVYTLFKEQLDKSLLFHGYQHTVDVVRAVHKICEKEDVNEALRDRIVLAAWFHDVGFVDTYEGHEAASAKRARAFLEDHDLPEDDIREVERLILSTKPDHEPQSYDEEVMRDADLSHIGKKKFFNRSERLRQEWQLHRGESYTDQEWYEFQLRFLTTKEFHTDYARKQYGDRKRKNIKKLRRRLGDMLDSEKPMPRMEDDKKDPKRGKETLFRSAYRTHINLSSIADAKANIMISINAILMSIIISFISTRAQIDTWLLIPATVLLIAALIAIVFAILSARPKVTNQHFTLEDVRKNRSNILFFGNFVNLPLDTFKVGIREIIEDWDLLYDAMASDLHSLGKVLAKKYRLLWISYTVFMSGLVLSVVLLLILFFYTTSATPV